MKEYTIYTGKIIELRKPPELSSVVLKEVVTGKNIETDAVSEKLIEEELQTGDEFEVIIQEDCGMSRPILKKIDPKPLIPEDINQINKEVDSQLDCGGDI